MSVDRGTGDPIDTIRCGRLDRKLAAPRLKERGELIRNHPDCRHSISQPGFEQFGVGDGRLVYGATGICVSQTFRFFIAAWSAAKIAAWTVRR
jgi:hypothetical protein